jgi:3-phenylpropionate/cinnamic acid dioxygenase small subunit
VLLEARLLDETRYDEWNALFTDDGIYWVPLVPDQPEGLQHTSHLYEDRLLRELRIERLKSPRAFSQQPRSRSHHLLQAPSVEQLDARPTALSHAVRSTTPRRKTTRSISSSAPCFTTCACATVRCITLKRVNLLNCDAALPAVQLFI